MNESEETESGTIAQVDELAELLLRHKFRWTTETDLHEGIAEVLQNCGVSYEHEKRLSKTVRADFWCSPVAIEIKVAGGLSDVTRQLMDYASLDQVEAVILVTTKLRHRNMPPTMRSKCVRVVYLSPL